MRIAKDKKPAMVETGMINLNINVPGLVPETVKAVRRDIRRALENCGRLDLLKEFTEVLMVEYREVPIEEAN